MLIERAKPEDHDAVAALTQVAYRGYVSLLGREPTPMAQNHKARIAQGEVFLAISADALCGVIVLENHGSETLIYSIVVAPEMQGQGVGQRLLRFAEARARAKGHVRMRLCTSDKMHRNVRIYLAFGYREVGREDLDLESSPTIVWFIKDL